MRLLVGYVAGSLRTTDKRLKLRAANGLRVKAAQKSAKSARKPAVEKAIVIDSDSEDFDAQGQAFAEKMLAEVNGESAQPSLLQATTSQAALHTTAVTSTPEVGVFRTKISPFGPTKFVYTDDAATVTEFLDVVRRKWDVPLHTRVKGVRVFMDGQEICVDIAEERDWMVVKKLLRSGSGVADALIDFIH